MRVTEEPPAGWTAGDWEPRTTGPRWGSPLKQEEGFLLVRRPSSALYGQSINIVPEDPRGSSLQGPSPGAPRRAKKGKPRAAGKKGTTGARSKILKLPPSVKPTCFTPFRTKHLIIFLPPVFSNWSYSLHYVMRPLRAKPMLFYFLANTQNNHSVLYIGSTQIFAKVWRITERWSCLMPAR